MTMTPAERADVFERILRPALRVLADPASPPETAARAREALRKVTAMIDRLHGFSDPQERRSPGKPAPHDAPAHARKDPADEAEAARLRANGDRENEGLRGIRKGRRQCEATTRSGARCKAPAIPGGYVCRHHGGEAPQVQAQAVMMMIYEARYNAGKAWEAARGTPGEFDALCALSRADNAVKDAEAKMDRIRELRAELRSARENTPREAP